VAARDWATWHPITCQQTATCRHPIGSHVRAVLPRHFATPASVPCHVTYRTPSHHCHVIADVTCATCHPSSGDTCHFRIGPTARQKCQISLTRVTLWSRHVSCTESAMCQRMDLPRVLYGLTRVLYGLYGQVQSAFKILLVWLGRQNAISSSYRLCLTKKLYHQNQEDEPDAMVLVSSDSEHFHFLAFFMP
jgi:hypothetical protein